MKVKNSILAMEFPDWQTKGHCLDIFCEVNFAHSLAD